MSANIPTYSYRDPEAAEKDFVQPDPPVFPPVPKSTDKQAYVIVGAEEQIEPMKTILTRQGFTHSNLIERIEDGFRITVYRG